MKRIWKRILILVGIVLIVGTAYFLYVWYKPARDVRDESAVTVKAGDLLKAFGANEKEPKYLDKAVQVSGEVLEAKTNQQGKTVCILKTDDPFFGINCTFKDNQILKVGEQVIIKGICTGYLPDADVVMIECYLIK